MTEQEKEDLIWSCIQPAEMGCAPEMSDGYNEAEVYSTACRVLKAYQDSIDYQKMKEKADKWDKVQEVLQGAKLELRYSDGKTIELISEEK